ncbi:MAG: hypothetical protein ACFFCZ_23730 [Promethearchaeota archaeon]
MVVDEIGLFTILACVIGILDFLFSLNIMRKILGLFPQEAKIKKYWYSAVGLVIIFGLGYIVAILSVIADLSEFNRIMVPIVYLFGSIFVVIMVLVSFRTYKMIMD